MTDEWRRKLSTLPRLDDPERVWRLVGEESRRELGPPPPSPGRGPRILAAVVAFAVFGGAVALALGAFGDDQAPLPGQVLGADTLELECTTTGPGVVVTPVVNTQPDGLHYEVAGSPGDVIVLFDWPANGTHVGQEGDGPEGVVPVSPGHAGVWCARGAMDAEVHVTDFVLFTLNDPGRYFVRPGLDCTDPYEIGAPLFRHEGEPDRIPGVLGSDEIEEIGYVASDDESSSRDVVVVRQGARVAQLALHQFRDRPMIGAGEACPGSGFESSSGGTPGVPENPAIPYQYQSSADGGYVVSDVAFRQVFDGWEIEFDESWTGEYPGVRDCSMTAWGEDGQVLVTREGQRDSLTPHPGRASVHVEAKPGRVEFSCGPRLDTPVTYAIEDVALDRRGNMIVLSYSVVVPSIDGIPATNACTAWLELPDGSRIENEHQTFTAPSGHSFRHRTMEFRDDRLDGTPLSDLAGGVDCHPWSETDLLPSDR